MKKNISSFLRQKKSGRQITMLTAYEQPSAQLLSQAGVDVILVGDSLGTNVLGYDRITQVTMQDMLHHTAAVVRGAGNTFVIGDMPYRSFRTPSMALKNASRFISCGADAVKMEGGAEMAGHLRLVSESGIPVCAHIGYLPQSGEKPHVAGKTAGSAEKLIKDAVVLEDAGAFMIVIELVPQELAAAITKLLRIPTIGIGAGPFCNGQVQVFHDIVGLSPTTFRHSKMFCEGTAIFSQAISRYVQEVKNGTFPTKANASSLPTEVAEEIKEWIKNTSFIT
jgi:3-methyl-2-oxobutanoate hydroxymethyltransferase